MIPLGEFHGGWTRNLVARRVPRRVAGAKERASRNPTEPNSTVTKPPWMTGRPAAYGRRGRPNVDIYRSISSPSLPFLPSKLEGRGGAQDDASRRGASRTILCESNIS